MTPTETETRSKSSPRTKTERVLDIVKTMKMEEVPQLALAIRNYHRDELQRVERMLRGMLPEEEA